MFSILKLNALFLIRIFLLQFIVGKDVILRKTISITAF